MSKNVKNIIDDLLKKRTENIGEAIDTICNIYNLADVERMKYTFPKLNVEISIILCNMIKEPEKAVIVVVRNLESNKVTDFKIIKDLFYGFNFDKDFFSVVSKRFSLSCDLKKHYIKVLCLDEGNEEDDD
ncbi:hypothetical protein M0R19_08240 [Candidatus Pacearchaeota archaeon]|jgi:hypothetical protein|nr:hypothetical protein [bacterium]MCK9597146.1 hypothetical protein [Candidatus Pacearchaeota archaeon]